MYQYMYVYMCALCVILIKLMIRGLEPAPLRKGFKPQYLKLLNM